MSLDLESPKSHLRWIAQRLLASSFYLSVVNTLTSDAGYHISAVVRCRFPDDSEELRRLGEVLMTGQNVRFQPHFLYEAEQDANAQMVSTPIKDHIIQTMVTRASWVGPRMSFTITKPQTPIVILIRLTEQGEQHPISGFPRTIVPMVSQRANG